MPESLFFLIKLQAQACKSIKKETLAQVFCYEFCDIFKKIYFAEHLLTPLLFESRKRVTLQFCL